MAATKTPDVTIQETDESGDAEHDAAGAPDGTVINPATPAQTAPGTPADFRRRATVRERKAVR